MKRVTYMTAMLLIAGATTLSSCRKEGCTDKTAKNYNQDAKKDDGTCTYEGSVVFWIDQSTSANLLIAGETSLTFYFDGVVVGSQAATTFWTGAPECGQNGSITVTKSLGGVKSKSFPFKVLDQDGITIWESNITLNANTCLKEHLQ